MRLKPLHLSFTDCPVGQLHSGFAFPLLPVAFAMPPVQVAPGVYASACRSGTSPAARVGLKATVDVAPETGLSERVIDP
jgi:hypothetical protein